MSIALLVTAVVPLVAVFAVAAWLLPRAGAEAGRDRVAQVAETAARSATAACQALGDRAQSVASQVRVSEPAEFGVASRRAVRGGAARDPSGAVAVYDGTGAMSASAGDAVAGLPADLTPVTGQDAATLSCSAGGVQGRLLTESVNVADGIAATVVVGVPAVQAAASGVPRSLGDAVGLVVVDASGDVAGWTDGAGVDQDVARAAARAVADVDGGVAAAVEGGAVSLVVDRRDMTVEAMPGGYVVAVSDPARPALAGWLVLPLVVFGAALVVLATLLAKMLTRPLTELSALARGISGAAAEAPRQRPDDDVELVGTTLTDLERGLAFSETDVVRARSAFVAAIGHFAVALDRSPDSRGLLRTVAEAALLAVEGRLAVVTFTDPVPSPVGAADHSAVADRAAVAVFAPGADRGAAPVVLDGSAEEIELSDPADLVAAAEGMRRLHDLGDGPDHVVADDPAQGWAAVLPMSHLGTVVGRLAVTRRPADGAPDSDSLAALVTLAANSGAALVNVSRHQQTAQLSLTDPLTAIGNVRALTATLAREVERAIRFGHNLAVIMIDLDHFKAVNDTHGHARGDLVLVEVSRRLASCVREVDTVTRYGGEEFCILLPETDLDGAAVLAHRLLTAVAGETFTAPDGPDVYLTVSVGVASYPLHGRSGAEVMKVADDALYEAKRAGRNRVVAAEAEPDAAEDADPRAASAASPDGTHQPPALT